MRFYRRSDQAVLQVRNPQVRFFLLGPIYLLWLRLWQEAIIVALGVWTLVHGAVVLTQAITGAPAGVDLQSAFAALDALRAAASRGVSADAAFGQLLQSLLPFMAAGVTLLVVMSTLTALLPTYLERRFGRRGWQLLNEETANHESPIYGF